MDYLAARMVGFLDEFPDNPVSRVLRAFGQKGDRPPGLGGRSPFCPNALTDLQLVRHRVLSSCLHGVDTDPLAVEVARLSLYLHGAVPGLPTAALGERLRCANALLAATFDDVATFHVVLGNPPYGATLDADTLTAARKQLPLMANNADTAVGFLERALRLARPGGRVGFILPKPLLYSYAWRMVRAALRGRVHHLADVSRAWRDVRLEQVIVVMSPEETSADAYAVSTLNDGYFAPQGTIPWTWADQFQTFPCELSAEERTLLQALASSPITIGQLCKSFRGLPLQRALGKRGYMPVVGGRDLTRWQIRSVFGLPARGRAAAGIGVPRPQARIPEHHRSHRPAQTSHPAHRRVSPRWHGHTRHCE